MWHSFLSKTATCSLAAVDKKCTKNQESAMYVRDSIKSLQGEVYDLLCGNGYVWGQEKCNKITRNLGFADPQIERPKSILPIALDMIEKYLKRDWWEGRGRLPSSSRRLKKQSSTIFLMISPSSSWSSLTETHIHCLSQVLHCTSISSLRKWVSESVTKPTIHLRDLTFFLYLTRPILIMMIQINCPKWTGYIQYMSIISTISLSLSLNQSAWWRSAVFFFFFF